MSIWTYSKLFKPIVNKNLWKSLDEGNTPLDVLDRIGSTDDPKALYIKREDQNPTGSHKDRSLAFQISAHLHEGAKAFVISSSGNSAISAAAICKAYKLPLDIFLSLKLNEVKATRLSKILGKTIDKRQILQNFGKITLNLSTKPLSDAIKYSKATGAALLRGSTDRYALEGYKTIAFELLEQAPDITDIFIPTSSGTTALGVTIGYEQVRKMRLIKQIPAIHVVQTEKVSTIAKQFDRDFKPSTHSIADSIVDRVGHRRNEVIAAVQKSKGSGWVVSDDAIMEALKWLETAGIVCSPEGAMGLAAINKATAKDVKIKRPVILVTCK